MQCTERPTAQSDGYSVRWLSSVEETPCELWPACFPPPLEGSWWYSALERSGVESQFTFAYALIEREKKPVGVAPCFLMDLDFRMVPNRFIKRVVAFVAVYLPSLCGMRILFVGSPCSEGAVGLIPGCGLAEVLPALLPAVRFYA